MMYVNIMVTIEAMSLYNAQREKEGNSYVALFIFKKISYK